MRKFTFGEQALISKLIANSADPAACFPIKTLEAIFQDNKLTFHVEDLAYFNFYVNEGKEESVKEKIKAVYNRLLEAFNLLDYLKAEGLVTELVSSREKKTSFGDDVNYVSAGLVEVRVFVEEDLIVEKLLNFINNAVYVSDALKELQADEFKTFEDKSLAESQKMVKKARTAVVFAFLAVVIAIAGIVLSAMGILGGGSKASDASAALKPAIESIQTSIDEKLVPAVVDVKTAVGEVKTAVDNMGAEPVSLSDLQKESSDDGDSKPAKKKSKKRKR